MNARIRKIFGGNVRVHRRRLRLTQEQLAEQTELDTTYVSGIERGRRNPTLEVIVRLAAGLRLNASVLCVGVGTQPEGAQP